MRRKKKSFAYFCYPFEEKIPVSLLGCSLVFLLGKNKRRRNTKLMKTVIIFSFVCSARDTRDTRDNGLLKKHQEDKDHKKHRIRARIFYLLFLKASKVVQSTYLFLVLRRRLRRDKSYYLFFCMRSF